MPHADADTGRGFVERKDLDGLAAYLAGFVEETKAGGAEVENQYGRAVRREGNPQSRRLIDDVFEVCDRKWRGVGLIPKSGYKLRDEYRDHDAERRFEVDAIETQESSLCISGQILKGLKKPHDCPAFGKECTPQTPLGATMVSSEGACAAYHAYGRHLERPPVRPPAGTDTLDRGRHGPGGHLSRVPPDAGARTRRIDEHAIVDRALPVQRPEGPGRAIKKKRYGRGR